MKPTPQSLPQYICIIGFSVSAWTSDNSQMVPNQRCIFFPNICKKAWWWIWNFYIIDRVKAIDQFIVLNALVRCAFGNVWLLSTYLTFINWHTFNIWHLAHIRRIQMMDQLKLIGHLAWYVVARHLMLGARPEFVGIRSISHFCNRTNVFTIFNLFDVLGK